MSGLPFNKVVENHPVTLRLCLLLMLVSGSLENGASQPPVMEALLKPSIAGLFSAAVGLRSPFIRGSHR